MTLDLSSVPTGWLLPILLLSLGVVAVVTRSATARYKSRRNPKFIGILVLIGGAALAVSCGTAVEFWLVRPGA